MGDDKELSFIKKMLVKKTKSAMVRTIIPPFISLSISFSAKYSMKGKAYVSSRQSLEVIWQGGR